MGFIDLKEVAQLNAEGQYDRVTYYHDTTTFKDSSRRDVNFSPRRFDTVSAPPYPTLLGSYCKGTELVEVYHADAQNGRSRLVFTANSPQCAVAGGGTGEGEGATTSVHPGNDRNAPVGGILLRRLYRAAVSGGVDVFRYTDKYYVPSTRSDVEVVSTRNEERRLPDYYRPTTEIIDRWCADYGIAPFTEIRVTHGGEGASLRTPVDNVSTCTVPPCSFALALGRTVAAGPLGRGAQELLPLRNTGEVVYTLGSPDNPEQPEGYFESLPVGRYVGYGRETRDNGCRASLPFRVTATYGPRYRMPYRDFDNTACELFFDFRGYTGLTEDLLGQSNACSLDYPQGSNHVVDNALRGSSIDIRVLITERNQLLDTYSSDERYVRLRLLRDGIECWRGWLLPGQYDIAHLSPPNEFNLMGTDGLGALAGVPFADPAGNLLTGQWTALQVVLHCLNRLELDLPIHVLDTLYPQEASTQESSFTQFSVDVASYRTDKGKAMSCEQVLRHLLDSRGARIYQDPFVRCWRLERLTDLSITPMQYFAYSADGERLPDPEPEVLFYSISQPPPNDDGGPFYVGGQQRKAFLEAVGRVEITAEPGELLNLLGTSVRWAEKDFDEAGKPVGWGGSAPTARALPLKKSDPNGLRLQGSITGPPGLYIQTPPTIPLVSPPHPVGPLHVTITARIVAVGGTMSENLDYAALPRMQVAVRQGSTWLAVGNSGTSETQVFTQPMVFDATDKDITIQLNAYSKPGLLAEPVVVRLYQITRGSAPRYDVEITKLALEWEGSYYARENYQDSIEEISDALFTLEDKALTLFHTDTPGARLQGTMLGPTGLPTSAWFQRDALTTLTTLPAVLLAERAQLQATPVGKLTGTLRGRVHPCALLTDPQELTPTVYLITAATINDVDATTEFTAVELLSLGLPAAEPNGLLVTEDEDPILLQSGGYALAEDGDGE
ncbi:hypothetical protein [Hymenobacter mucosus]|uniref:Uncharacterized protein n=1 Tax=Hymenobacter mucosus TaxID=1411120 RepID=A0A239ACU0_9BACT|nr:hypothetical protein [Hymenobacter mucosus]SNR92703.1 hypothetical protein SAMN06269173_111116 [Hymenobacter mucosus]